ncbi:hypothetical protein QBC38DRAFT_448460 [Podospora fimiseda]|uniref:Uncharacterized protein n=1 Tax=Podospora fimiseda TaxID=252190 RepID=A0AAN6YMZ5_9PEZI|nr:hypothetical protein QBC38DRAFT_448460 [Podospora fimiseda]
MCFIVTEKNYHFRCERPQECHDYDSRRHPVIDTQGSAAYQATGETCPGKLKTSQRKLEVSAPCKRHLEQLLKLKETERGNPVCLWTGFLQDKKKNLYPDVAFTLNNYKEDRREKIMKAQRSFRTVAENEFRGVLSDDKDKFLVYMVGKVDLGEVYEALFVEVKRLLRDKVSTNASWDAQPEEARCFFLSERLNFKANLMDELEKERQDRVGRAERALQLQDTTQADNTQEGN